MAQVTPANLAPFVWVTLVVAFAGATSTSAWMPIASRSRSQAQGALLATYSLGYRIALIVTGAWRWRWPDHLPWPMVYRTMAAFLLIPVVAVFFAREPEVARVRTETWRAGIREGWSSPSPISSAASAQRWRWGCWPSS